MESGTAARGASGPRWLALDIGGANIKVADGAGFSQAYPFALWREPGLLAQQVRTAISEAPPCDHLAVTMTGELADCFESKAAGVRHILQAVQNGSDNRHTRVYLVDGRLVTPQAALNMPQLVAASNWHALARFAGRYARTGTALLIDVGSTTCDVIALSDGQPANRGKTDTERLVAGELVYTGVERSPVCALVSETPYRGRKCPVVQELFATMRDVYLVLDMVPDDPADTATADGKPATTPFARARLGRMVAADAEEFNHRDAVVLAQAAAESQAKLLAGAIQQVIDGTSAAPQKVVLSGHGEFLGKRALETMGLSVPVVALSKELGPMASRCAPAYALAVLASELTGKAS